MPITQSLNSKANIKKTTNQDLPFSPQQPVIARYNSVSTSGQTVINLTFTVDTTFTDIFFLFVDGKKLTIGSSNDYTFTSIGADGTSSQVTLNQSLPINLNIEAFKLGLKKESEFQTDNRFVGAYDYLDKSFQAFVSQSAVLSATTTTGTPAAGTFYSTISNRASLVDLSQDLKPRMGIDRMSIQSIYQLQTEFGPNGEPIWATPNDTFGQLRFVGGDWSNSASPPSASFGGTTGTYMEVTFYGTGLNLLTSFYNINWSSTSLAYSVDGGTQTTVPNLQSTYSSILHGRSYSDNSILPIVSGLAIGVHTVKIVCTAAVANGISVYGVDILNESSLVKVPPGISYLKGQKYASSALQSFAYNAPVTGTRGGRVVVYQKSDGTIGQAWQAANASSATLSSADHTNEEIVRSYNWREFGAGRSDDFSISSSSGASLAFTLDDGTTSLTATSARTNVLVTGIADVLINSGNGQYITFTFVGTGCDYLRYDTGAGGADTHTLSVDGAAPITLATTGTGKKFIQKLVSGLPYGTHTVTITRTSVPSVSDPGIIAFLVYQPKKPSIPAGAVELADYNVLATYSASTSALVGTVATGVLRKMGTREDVYVGTWTASLQTTPAIFDSGWNIQSSTAGSYHEYTFFGTGFEYGSFVQSGQARNHTITVDGSGNLTASNPNWPSISASLIGTGLGTITLNTSTGLISGTSAVGAPNRMRVQVSGLPLGLHKVRMTYNSSTDQVYSDTVDVITPIHSVKYNSIADFQNTLSVGSQGISDNRKMTAIKESISKNKAFAVANGITSNPTTAAGAYTPVPDMSLSVKITGDVPVRVLLGYAISLTPTANTANVQMVVNGVFVGTAKETYNSSQAQNISDNLPIVLPPGVHKVDLYWSCPSTLTARSTERTIYVIEV